MRMDGSLNLKKMTLTPTVYIAQMGRGQVTWNLRRSDLVPEAANGMIAEDVSRASDMLDGSKHVTTLYAGDSGISEQQEKLLRIIRKLLSTRIHRRVVHTQRQKMTHLLSPQVLPHSPIPIIAAGWRYNVGGSVTGMEVLISKLQETHTANYLIKSIKAWKCAVRILGVALSKAHPRTPSVWAR